MDQQLVLEQADIMDAVQALAGRWQGRTVDAVFGVPRGGCVPAAMVAALLHVPIADGPGPGVLVVDDLVDSGATAKRYDGSWFDALYRKSWSPTGLAPHAFDAPGDRWLVFPWERHDETAGPEDSVRRLLEHIGEDPNRPGLVDTPSRVVRALSELTTGYGLDPATVLERRFPDRCDELVVVTGIDFTSLCEHHLLPFTGRATVGYLPGDEVVGLSKLARLVDVYARRLQVQERMTMQIAEAIDTCLVPRAVGVVVRARHSCMGHRGVRKPGAEMVTSAMLGYLREKPELRAEFLALAGS